MKYWNCPYCNKNFLTYKGLRIHINNMNTREDPDPLTGKVSHPERINATDHPSKYWTGDPEVMEVQLEIERESISGDNSPRRRAANKFRSADTPHTLRDTVDNNFPPTPPHDTYEAPFHLVCPDCGCDVHERLRDYLDHFSNYPRVQ